MDKNKLILLAGIVVVIAIVFGIVQNLNSPSADSVINDFKNERLVSFSSIVLPDNIRERFEDDLIKHVDAQEAEENPFFAYLGEANVIMQLGDYELSLEKFEEAEKRYPDNYLITMNKGSLLVEMQQYLLAAKAYGEAINKKPREILPHLKLADLYLKHSSNPMGAEKVYIRALVETKDNREILKNYASFLGDQKEDYEQAIIYWDKALEKTTSIELRNAIKDKINKLLQKIDS